MAVVVSTANPARLQGVLRQHYKFNTIFVVDANGNYVPQRSTRTLFEFGVDDNAGGGTFANAGYSDAIGAANSIEITSAQKGGALSQTMASLILAVSFLPEHTPRVGLTLAGAADPNFTAALAPRRGGLVGDVEADLMSRFYATGMKGAQMSLLPSGTNTGCSIFLGIPQLQAPGTGFHNSEIPSMGFPSGSTRFTLGDDVIVYPTRSEASFKPNRIQLDWPTALPAGSTNDDAVELPGGLAARAAGTVVAMDMIAVVDFALVKLYDKSGNELDPAAVNGNEIEEWKPAGPFDAAKITAFRRCV